MPDGVLAVLNTAGLGLLGAGLAFIYHAFAMRSKLLEETLKEMQQTYKLVLEVMEKRSTVIDKRFEDERSFRDLYLSMFKDSEEHLEKIKAWRDGEIVKRGERLKELTAELEQTRDESRKDIRKLRGDNDKLTVELAVTKRQLDDLKHQVDRAIKDGRPLYPGVRE